MAVRSSDARFDDYMSQRETLERLVTLERDTDNKFKEMDKALVLARELVQRSTNATEELIQTKFEHVNNMREQMTDMRGLFATKEALDDFKAAISKSLHTTQITVAMIIGGLVVLEIVIRFMLKG